ncbi:MAG TPA: hypothetical protein VLN74_06325 [Ilumatobacteraceae bacterium]|nr:hypothetical protein [Ilumatobacteraceae bacterium]
MSQRPDDARRPGPDDGDRRSRLLGIKLRALVGEHLGRPVDSEPESFPHGAALRDDDAAWILVEGAAARSLGAALAWSIRHDATSLHLVAEQDTGLLARRAQRLAFPVTVWFPQDRVLLPVVAEPLVEAPPPSPEHVELVAVIEAAGATSNVEHGVVVGEVRGLEVCRVVDQPTVGHFAELGDIDIAPSTDPSTEMITADGVLLEVGVGANDREAFRLLHGDIPTVEALAAVVESVLAHRSPDAPQHPLNRLGQERYLRWQLEQDPGLVGMAAVSPAEPPQPRPNLKDPVPCVARAFDADGSESTVVCSVGVDFDRVGFVADVQEMADVPVIVALRKRDAVPITRDLLALLATPPDVRIV